METKTTLLNVAENLARTRGMDAFSFADLAKALDIRKASVHYHFPTKGDLAASLIERYANAFFDTLPSKGTAAEKLSAYLDVYASALGQGDQICLCVALGAGLYSQEPAVAEAVKCFHLDNLAWLQGVFELATGDGTVPDAGDPRAEAFACLAVVEGAQVMARAMRDPDVFEQAVATLRARLLTKEADICG